MDEWVSVPQTLRPGGDLNELYPSKFVTDTPRPAITDPAPESPIQTPSPVSFPATTMTINGIEFPTRRF